LSKRSYTPSRGDLVHLNLQPSAGSELTGPHYALVISTERFAKATGFAIVVPATSKLHREQQMAGQQLMVKLPAIPQLKLEGWIYPHQVKSLDFRDRGMSLVSKIDDLDFVIEVMDRVRAFIDPDSV